jgi:hypothetical protein
VDPALPLPPERRPGGGVRDIGKVLGGLFGVFVLHALYGSCALSLTALPLFPSRNLNGVVEVFQMGTMAVGLTQLLYCGPLLAWMLSVERTRMVGAGMVAGMALTFLLNAACWGVVAFFVMA